MSNRCDLAIVGGGLRLLSLLTAFADLVTEKSGSPGRGTGPVPSVLVFDPFHPAPGAVWNDRAHREFRCNALKPEAALPAPGGGTLLVTGALEAQGLHASAQDSPPRSAVGAALRDQRDEIIGRLSPRLAIRLVPARVEEAVPVGGSWLLRAGAESFACRGLVDLSGSGFTGYTVSATDAAESSGLSLDSIPPGAAATIGGMGLGAVDVVAALTRGRGGAFADRGGQLAYTPSGSEPALVLMSRTGRLRRPSDPGRPGPIPGELPVHVSDAFWSTSAEAAALQVLARITGTPRLDGLHRAAAESPEAQISAFEREPAQSRAELRSRVEGVVSALARERPAMRRIHQDALSRIATEYTSGPPLERYREWGALIRAGMLRFSRGTWGETAVSTPWRIRAFLGAPGLPFDSPAGMAGSRREIPVDARTKRVQGFDSWWAGGHTSSHPLRGDLPTTANAAEWQGAVRPLAEDIARKLDLLGSSVRWSSPCEKTISRRFACS
ncbi:FAD/NAD(P)-binding protein [Arthrobacter sp. UM1]|uniref:FAD/NAD(P)-binding protein n=1 Tax=Arthrobacter sp. UM1 TaxID=2766776 RepID=UPI001CF6EDC5|nr:FAD/NAD(P)-binding protein [Arthrobacter sp. UM1]